MARAVLITGIAGFVGSHLAEYLLKEGLEVYGTVRAKGDRTNVEHTKDRLRLIEADMNNARSVEKAIRESKPDYIFHLAATSSVFRSWRTPAQVMKTNVIGTVHLFEAIRKSGIDPRVQIAGSSEEYGMVYPEELPVRETNALRPLSPYAVSKVAQDRLSYQYHRSYGLKTVVTRAFNTTGPRRPSIYVTSSFARQVAEIEKGRQPTIYVGNLDARRDFSDVRDIVRAYWLALQRCEPGEVYNICSEKTRTIREVIDCLTSLTSRRIRVQRVPSRMRPADIQVMEGDCTKFKKQTRWVPEIPFETTMEDLLGYWRARV